MNYENNESGETEGPYLKCTMLSSIVAQYEGRLLLFEAQAFFQPNDIASF